jgi:hypothetical protein
MNCATDACAQKHAKKLQLPKKEAELEEENVHDDFNR